jgi:hypothetical protein
MVKLAEDYWRKLIKEYKESSLSKNAFCDQKGLALGQFKYHWRRAMENKRGAVESKGTALPRFEEVTITESDSLASSPANPSTICIQLPNQIRCEFEMAVSGPGLGLLLKQLVALC